MCAARARVVAEVRGSVIGDWRCRKRARREDATGLSFSQDTIGAAWKMRSRNEKRWGLVDPRVGDERPSDVCKQRTSPLSVEWEAATALGG
jgi:hypothetical protein